VPHTLGQARANLPQTAGSLPLPVGSRGGVRGRQSERKQHHPKVSRRRQEAREDAQCTAAAVIGPQNEEARLADQSHAWGARLARRDDRLRPRLHVDPPSSSIRPFTQPSRTTASPSPVDILHDNQVVALGPMLPTSDRFRLVGKNRKGAGRDRARRPSDVDGLSTFRVVRNP
jgi:hypothetical protein